jgi:hypothetical protein
MISTSPRQAEALFYFSNSLSRRDVATQLWLIEDSVRRNDIPGALSHYDAALRSSPSSQQLLIPVLVNATSERGIVPPLATILRTRPPWRATYLDALIAGAPSPDNLVQLLMMIGRPTSPEEEQLMARSINRLAEQNAFGPALRLYRRLAGDAPAGQLLRNGGFDRPNVYPPLDWQLGDSGDISAEPRPAQRAGERQSLYVRAATDARGQAARQLMLLSPGSYALSATSGRTGAPGPEGLSWQITCATAPNSQLLDQQATPAGPTAQTVRGEFRVPASGCPAQWVSLQIVAGDQPGGTEAWVASVRIELSNRGG